MKMSMNEVWLQKFLAGYVHGAMEAMTLFDWSDGHLTLFIERVRRMAEMTVGNGEKSKADGIVSEVLTSFVHICASQEDNKALLRIARRLGQLLGNAVAVDDGQHRVGLN